MENHFELFAFYSNPQTLEELIDADIDGIIIDWENKGKSQRQSLYNTQVNLHDANDLEFVCRTKNLNVICRINGPKFWSKNEISRAIDAGATEILLPMITSLDEVEFALNHVNGQVKTGLMLETNAALEIADQLNKMPIHRFFVGLNDLSIQRESRNLFLPFIDGTIDELRPKISKKFGIAGLTHPDAGEPIPCSYLINQMKKYHSSFGFLRRSFYKDLAKYTISEILNSLRLEFANNTIWKYKDLTIEEKRIFSQSLI